MFPKEISKIIGNLQVMEVVDYHRSGDNVYTVGERYILKVSNNVDRLKTEYEKDGWVSNYIISPKPITFAVENGIAYYLRECLLGENMCGEKYLSRPHVLIDLLVDALNTLHKTTVSDGKYIIDKGHTTLLHGDFCLPNILVQDDKVVGYIDLGDAGIGDPWRDYAWCIWSLEYNLETKKYTPLLLKKLGIQFDKEKFDKYTS